MHLLRCLPCIQGIAEDVTYMQTGAGRAATKKNRLFFGVRISAAGQNDQSPLREGKKGEREERKRKKRKKEEKKRRKEEKERI